MAPKRILPEAGNPLIAPEHAPPLDQLVERRRLGQTNLAVKPGQVNIANASKPENLGLFDYAHLRVPLPKNLEGSGIFSLSKSGIYPESYFLMRRSKDGHISATGMFKAAYPWASVEEEETERKFHKSLPTAGPEEVAGNVWIHPDDALRLAEDYGLVTWIAALLDPSPIEKGTKDKDKIEISTPPRFELPDKIRFPPPADTASVASSVRSRSKRERRSVSPSKIATPSRRIASPRKPRQRRTAKTDTDATVAATTALSTALSNDVENGIPAPSVEPSVVSESVDGENVRVEIDESVEKKGEVEVAKTSVVVEIPSEHPELKIPEGEKAEDMIALAKEMVEEAHKLEEAKAVANGVKASSKKQKRKIEEVEPEEEDTEQTEKQPAKKVKAIEEGLRKEKMKNRALLGVGVTLAIGTAVSWFL